MRTTEGYEEERLELEALLASGIFHRAPNLAQLLTYVCSKTFEGAADQIKEYNIAVEALGRPADFDQKRDSIVRVEAHRLRKRLKEFYDSDGAAHSVHIEIPPGQYAPEFLRKEGPATPVPLRPVEPAVVVPPVAAPVPAAPKSWVPGLGLAAVLLTCLAIGAWLTHPLKPSPKTGVAQPATKASPPSPPAQAAGSEFRILAGYQGADFIDRFGRAWQDDRYFNGGGVFEAADHVILGTRTPRLYRSRREGTFTYDIPLAPGSYELRLHFAETLYGESNAAGGGETSRLFNLYLNGVELLDQFDVIGEAGANVADIRSFKDVSPASDGKLHLKFESHTNLAFVNAIEILPASAGHIQPIRMVAQEHPYTGSDGHIWEPDRYARGGQLVARTAPIADAEDQELFRGERFGNFVYVIPLPPGKYGVTLHLTEAWFGPGTAAGGGVGSRVFDILCNGLAFRRSVDIYKEAHGANRALRITSHGLEPNAQGQLVLSFLPVKNYACVNAIEILDETPHK